MALVLVIVVMVSLAGYSFVATMSNEDKATRMRGEEIQAEQLVRSAQEMIRALLERTPDAMDSAGGLYDNEDLFRGVLVFEDELQKRRGRFTVIAPRIESDQIAGIRFGLENESAKLHLGLLREWEQQQTGVAQESLMQLPGMTESAAAAILDWMDEDSTPRQFGAEAEYYQTLARPYAPRNKPVESLEELLLIRDVSRELLYGADVNRNHQLEPAELARAEATGLALTASRPSTFLPWSSLLTVCSAERNVDPQGQPRIDLNDAQLSRLYQRLSDVLDLPLVNFIVAFRQFGTYQGSEAPNAPENLSVEVTQPGKFRIESPLDLVNARVRIPLPGNRPAWVLASPLGDDGRDLGEMLLQLMDYATVVTQPVMRGRININLAPAAVLEAIPGMDRATAQQIVMGRGSREGQFEAKRRHPVWLLQERLVELQQMKKLLPYLTCGGDVYRAQIVGFFDSLGPTARVEVVLDATHLPARQLYWKDLRILGRGYSWEMLGADAASEIDASSRFSKLSGARQGR